MHIYQAKLHIYQAISDNPFSIEEKYYVFYGTTNTIGDGECVKQMCVQCRKGKTYFKVERTVIKREKQCSEKRKTPPGMLTEWLQEELNMNTDRGQRRDGLVFPSLPA